MAVANFSAAPPAPAHPMANPGFGKRSAPDELPRGKDDFVHLPKREASLAAFIDRLPDGAAIDHKTLAKHIPDVGQAACRTALKALTDAGHLRRIREQVVRDDGSRWVTRTYFSRTARDEEWWQAFRRGERAQAPATGAEPAPARSTAYRTLAALGRTEPRMTLSAADCARLEPLAEAWLERDADAPQLIGALTAGLPAQVHSAAGIARRRLEDKMPPKNIPGPETVLQRIMLCVGCDASENVTKLTNGLCDDCRREEALPATFRAVPAAQDVAQRADAVRAAAGLPPRKRA
ncbi:hypothetical protein NLX86_07140 [Streptomyces sp. A3M-1-3]|uniref:hypothetical protein n=1 Tax=Streptomyces sp. A3M-1-3 TaxID=2962044 RepID=UPI0020B81B18|nr:hypothetical protein [Streptomyces sp. A3M-1-3]MCP3817915.1 hypothetical protein [Streptomyces sp. A3M-1-3]